MLRALLVILATLSAVLGAALGYWFLYVLAALLLVGAAGAWLLSLKGKFEIGRPDSSGFAPVEEEDLGALGILEIRPKNAAESAESAVQSEAVEEPRRSEELVADAGAQQYSIFEAEKDLSPSDRPREPMPVEQNGTAVPRAAESTPPATLPRSQTQHRKASQFHVVSSSGRIDRDVVLPCLESLCSALEANTVCLLGSEAGGKGHRIHAIVSRNAYARGGGELTPGNGMRWSSSRYVTVERAADSTWDPYDLQYYRETIAVKELAHVAIPAGPGETRWLLIADSMTEGVLGDARASQILEQYAGLLSSLVDKPARRRDDEAPAFRPRREIIAEEMERARENGAPLALALVMLSRAEEEDGFHPDKADELEQRLRTRVEESAQDIRVDRFGDFMFGAFVSSDVAEVEEWAARVQQSFDDTSEDFAGGVSIGAVMLTDRHTTPEQLRADAAAALQAAVKSKVCTILE